MSEKTKKSITIFKSPPFWIFGGAFLIMLIAKCFGFYPDLSWLAVTCPLWITYAIVAAVVIGFYVIAVAALIVLVPIAIILVTLEDIVGFFEDIFSRR